ncbi:MAG: hypothetical protein ABR589_03490 [Chthoniobacterales bacterium]
MEEFENVRIILLRRDLAQVLKSFVELGFFRPKPCLEDWMILPAATSSSLFPAAELDQFDRCIAYLLDIEERAIRFRGDYPAVPVYEVARESLNTIAEVGDFFATLKITPTADTIRVCGRRSNERATERNRSCSLRPSPSRKPVEPRGGLDK